MSETGHESSGISWQNPESLSFPQSTNSTWAKERYHQGCLRESWPALHCNADDEFSEIALLVLQDWCWTSCEPAKVILYNFSLMQSELTKRLPMGGNLIFSIGAWGWGIWLWLPWKCQIPLALRQSESIRSDKGLTLETSAFRISVRWPIYIINSVDKTKFLYTTSPPTQHHSFFRNYPLIYFCTAVWIWGKSRF